MPTALARYAVKTIDTSVDFSTSEVNTGVKWIDGKTIYRKVIDVGPLPNSGTEDTPHGIANLDSVISAAGFCDNGSGNYRPIGYVPDLSNSGISIQIAGSYVRIKTSISYTTYSGFVILEYTKTT